jgi:hypothetical protein
MATIRLPTQMVHSRQQYNVTLSDAVTTGRLARYLSQQEAYVDASTLEIARPVQPTQRIQDVDVQPADRLVIFTGDAENAELAAPLRQGDKLVKFAVGDSVVASRGKKSLLIGKPDGPRETAVDIDLRNFIPPKSLNFISRESLRLDYDDRSKTWFATKVGRSRVLMDEYEITADKVPLGDYVTLRFYRAADDPRSTRPLGEIHVIVETVQSRDDIIYLEQGNRLIHMQVGVPRESVALNVSENVTLGQIVTSLAAYHRLGIPQNVTLYLLRLLAPETHIGDLKLGSDEFLYTSRSQSYAHNLLILRDIHDRERKFELAAGLEDDEKLIGRRSESSVEDPELDVDLYEVLVRRSNNPDAFKSISRRQLRIVYKAAENTWWVRPEERSSVPVFLNNVRTTSGTPTQLTSGDVLSIGQTVDNYYARLEVEITSKAD